MMRVYLITEVIQERLMRKYQSLFEEAVRKMNSLPQGAREVQEAHREVKKYAEFLDSEGCFRDHASASVLSTLGLSWWSDVLPLCNGDWELKGENLKEFRRMVAEAKQCLPPDDVFGQDFVRLYKERLERCREHLVERHVALVAFLDQAIALNASVRCLLS